MNLECVSVQSADAQEWGGHVLARRHMESELSNHLQSHHKNKVLSYTCTRSERLMPNAMHAAVDTMHADDAFCYSECLLLLLTMLDATAAVVLSNITCCDVSFWHAVHV